MSVVCKHPRLCLSQQQEQTDSWTPAEGRAGTLPGMSTWGCWLEQGLRTEGVNTAPPSFHPCLGSATAAPPLRMTPTFHLASCPARNGGLCPSAVPHHARQPGPCELSWLQPPHPSLPHSSSRRGPPNPVSPPASAPEHEKGLAIRNASSKTGQKLPWRDAQPPVDPGGHLPGAEETLHEGCVDSGVVLN